jgi:hypothetical protein
MQRADPGHRLAQSTKALHTLASRRSPLGRSRTAGSFILDLDSASGGETRDEDWDGAFCLGFGLFGLFGRFELFVLLGSLDIGGLLAFRTLRHLKLDFLSLF